VRTGRNGGPYTSNLSGESQAIEEVDMIEYSSNEPSRWYRIECVSNASGSLGLRHRRNTGFLPVPWTLLQADVNIRLHQLWPDVCFEDVKRAD
jgi:hypothetical protein